MLYYVYAITAGSIGNVNSTREPLEFAGTIEADNGDQAIEEVARATGTFLALSRDELIPKLRRVTMRAEIGD